MRITRAGRGSDLGPVIARPSPTDTIGRSQRNCLPRLCQPRTAPRRDQLLPPSVRNRLVHRTNPVPTGLLKWSPAVENGGAKSAHHLILTNRPESQETQKALGDKGLKRSGKTRCNHARLHQYPPMGVEQTADSSENRGGGVQGGAKSGALSGDSALSDPDLAAVVAAWPSLPATVRQRMVMLAKGRGADAVGCSAAS